MYASRTTVLSRYSDRASIACCRPVTVARQGDTDQNNMRTVVILRPRSTVPSARAVVAPDGSRRTQCCQTVVRYDKNVFLPGFCTVAVSSKVQKRNLLTISEGSSRSISICVTTSFNSKTKYMLSADVALLTPGVGRESTADQSVGGHSSTISTPVISYRTPLCSS